MVETIYTLSYEFCQNTPLFRCNYCGRCADHIEAQNNLRMNRGCCWYYPTYELVDIKNIMDNGHEEFIHRILADPRAHIHHFELQVPGRFDHEAFEQYLAAIDFKPKDDFDLSLHFKLCPFVGTQGCTIEPSLRPHPCNLYLCRELIQMAGDDYPGYQQERKDYFAYCAYVNEGLRAELQDEDADFVRDPQRTLAILRTLEIPRFAPKGLPPIDLIPTGRPVSA